jgi:hypothetical protein
MLLRTYGHASANDSDLQHYWFDLLWIALGMNLLAIGAVLIVKMCSALLSLMG